MPAVEEEVWFKSSGAKARAQPAVGVISYIQNRDGRWVVGVRPRGAPSFFEVDKQQRSEDAQAGGKAKAKTKTKSSGFVEENLSSESGGFKRVWKMIPGAGWDTTQRLDLLLAEATKDVPREPRRNPTLRHTTQRRRGRVVHI